MSFPTSDDPRDPNWLGNYPDRMEATVPNEVDRIIARIERMETGLHGRMDKLDEKIGTTREELAAHKGKLAGIATIVGLGASLFGAFLSKLISGSGSH